MQVPELAPRAIDDYRDVAGRDALDALHALAERLQGVRVLHLNATATGGGVAEILRSEVPLLRDLGLDVEWRVLTAPYAFFEVTKQMHNRLQGADGRMTSEEQQVWLDGQRSNAERLDGSYDIVVVHDPQPAGLIDTAHGIGRHWIWRLHIDSSHPHPGVWSFLRPYIDRYELLVFTMPDFVPGQIPLERVRFVAPAIDPLIPKNQPIAIGKALETIDRLGIDLRRPWIAQVSRLDPWKDPCGVIDAYRLARREHHGLQLALVGAMDAADDPEAARVAAEVEAHAGDDSDIHIYTDPAQIRQLQVGAVQQQADVILQKSIREGFGLTVTEAMWKGTPVIGGRVGGIPLQLQDGQGGYLVESLEEAAERCDQLLADPPLARAVGAAGREVVRQRFLITRLLADELALYLELLNGSAAAPPPRHATASATTD
jgi:trehalose synthase